MSRRATTSTLTLAALLAVWLLLSELHLVDSFALPSPIKVAARGYTEFGMLAQQFAITMVRAAIGYVLGCGSGILVAVVAARSSVFRAIIEPLIQVLKAVPLLVVVPLIILWFGFGETGKYLLIWWGCFFILVLETAEAIKNVPRIYIWAAASLGASENRTYWSVVLPAMIPGVIGALRVAVVTTFTITVWAEFVMASGGLGELLIRGYSFLRTDVLFLAAVTVTLAALLSDWVVRSLVRYFIRWL